MVDKLVFLAGIVLSLVFLPVYVNDSFGGLVVGATTLGDFGCRFIDTPGIAPFEAVQLTDQFGTDVYFLEAPDELCSFGQKTNAGGFPDSVLPDLPGSHYMVYNFLPPVPPTGIQVELTDQFGTDTHTVFQPHTLWVPAFKDHLGDIFPSPTDIHWLCYDISIGTFPFIPLNFQDQFQLENLSLDQPFAMCNPVIKQLLDPITGAPLGPPTGTIIDEHLKCYDTFGSPFFSGPSSVLTSDQFQPMSFGVFEINSICLVADKFITGVPPAVGGTLIPIDTVSLFLAGASISMLWIIPVVGAGAGIAIFALKRNH